MRELITDTIELLGYQVHVIFNYRDYPVLIKDADVSPALGYKAPDGVATYCYRHNDDLILFLNNGKHNYTTPKVIYHLAKYGNCTRHPLMTADQFWSWYTHDVAHLYYEDTNGNLINHINPVHTVNMWDKPKDKKAVKHHKNNSGNKALVKKSNHQSKVINQLHKTIKEQGKDLNDYKRVISNYKVNSYADKVVDLIQTKPNTTFHYSLFRFTELMRNLGLFNHSAHMIKEWMIANAYLVKVGWNDYVPAAQYSNLFITNQGLFGHHKVELSQLGFVYFTNTIYGSIKA